MHTVIVNELDGFGAKDEAAYEPDAAAFWFAGRRWPNDDEEWRRNYDAVRDPDWTFSTDEVEEMEAHRAWLAAREEWRMSDANEIRTCDGFTPEAPKKVLYLDMDGVIVDFESAKPRVDAKLLAEFDGDFDKVPGIFALMDPMPGAIEAVTELTGLFDVYVLSTVPWGNTSGASQKIEWIQRHFGHEKGTPLWKRVILSHHKHLNRGDFLVDDRPTHNGAGGFVAANPGGEVLHFGGPDFPDWPAVVAYLKERA